MGKAELILFDSMVASRIIRSKLQGYITPKGLKYIALKASLTHKGNSAKDRCAEI